MSGLENQQVEIKFRLVDGSDIGPQRFEASAGIDTVKKTILLLWPQDKEVGPTCVDDLRLIMGGRELNNGDTVGKCRKSGTSPGFIVMHVLVRPPSTKHRRSRSSIASTQNDDGCTCLIM